MPKGSDASKAGMTISNQVAGASRVAAFVVVGWLAAGWPAAKAVAA